MKTPALVFAALLSLALTAAPAPAGASGPAYFVIMCEYPRGPQKLVAFSPSEIPEMIAKCRAGGGHVSGVTPVFKRIR